MRSAAQIVSYEIAMGFALVCVLMMSGSLNLIDVIYSQSNNYGVFGGINSFISNVCRIFHCWNCRNNRAPFDVLKVNQRLLLDFMLNILEQLLQFFSG